MSEQDKINGYSGGNQPHPNDWQGFYDYNQGASLRQQQERARQSAASVYTPPIGSGFPIGAGYDSRLGSGPRSYSSGGSELSPKQLQTLLPVIGVLVALPVIMVIIVAGYLHFQTKVNPPILTRLPVPKPLGTVNGWQVYNGADLEREMSLHTYHALHLEGNTLIRGSLSQVIIKAKYADFRIEGPITNSTIETAVGGSFVGRAVDHSTVMMAGMKGSIKVDSVNHSNIYARQVSTANVIDSEVTCEAFSGPPRMKARVNQRKWENNDRELHSFVGDE